MSSFRPRLAVALVCFAILLGGAFLAKTASPPRPATPSVRWVRTRYGWQAPDWEQERTSRAPSLHPAVLASFIALASATALVAFPRRVR